MEISRDFPPVTIITCDERKNITVLVSLRRGVAAGADSAGHPHHLPNTTCCSGGVARYSTCRSLHFPTHAALSITRADRGRVSHRTVIACAQPWETHWIKGGNNADCSSTGAPPPPHPLPCKPCDVGRP